VNDVVCGECGEPWEYYYITYELAEDTKERILRGDGCPSCEFGASDRATGEYQLERVQSIQQNTDLDPVKYANL